MNKPLKSLNSSLKLPLKTSIAPTFGLVFATLRKALKPAYVATLIVFALFATAYFATSGMQTSQAAGLTKYPITTGGNWSADATWTLNADGTANATTKPDAADDVIMNATSGPITIDATAVAKSLNCTGYTNTLTHNAVTLTVSGSVTLAAGMTYTPLATSTIIMNATGTLTTGGKLLPLLTSTSGTLTLGDNLSFMDSKVLQFTLSGTAVDLNGKTVAGNSATNRVLIQSATIGTPATITVSAGTFANADFMDIAFANGGADLNLSAITGLSGNCGGNAMSGGGALTFTTSAAQTATMATSKSWSDVTIWTSRVPLPQDDVSMASVTGGTLTADMPRLGRSISWTGATGTPTWTLASSNTSYGSVTLIAGITLTHSSGTYYLAGRSAYTLTSASKNFYSLYFNAPGGTYTLADALTSSGNLTINAGTLTHAANGTTAQGEMYKVNMTVGGNFTLGASGTINVNGKGYAANQGTGKPTTGYGGGSYGGLGAVTPGSTYGSLTAPVNI
ncbi:MAG: hypothetical protein ABIJ72_04370, partial [bacterium]